MPSGRRVRIAGKAMVMNFNTKGGIRKAGKTSKYNSCVAGELTGKKFGSRAAQKAGFRSAAKKCKGTKN